VIPGFSMDIYSGYTMIFHFFECRPVGSFQWLLGTLQLRSPWLKPLVTPLSISMAIPIFANTKVIFREEFCPIEP